MKPSLDNKTKDFTLKGTKKHEKILDTYEQFPDIYQKNYFYINNKKVMFYIMGKYFLKKAPKSYILTIKEGYKNCKIENKTIGNSRLK